ncbi:hypothetical protein F4801DRAFT_417254 [Xylaria longipes]|nr:hypothetical protein F4801DRAFT_417254 [Xylaria longipes]
MMSSFPWREENDEQDGLMGGLVASSARTSYYKKRSSRLCFAVAFLTMIIAVLATILVVVFIRGDSHQQRKQQKQQELPSWLPPQRQVNKVFQPEDVFGGDPSIESKKAWDGLFPEGRGFVEFNDTITSNPPPGRLATISMFHQLHCLEMIRIGYFATLSGNPEAIEQGPRHLRHCWDFLRQGIMCHGDTTLEWVHEGDPGSKGWGYDHKCNDFDAIFSWVEAHKFHGVPALPSESD